MKDIDYKILEDKTDKETSTNSSANEKQTPTADTVRPLGKRRSRRRLPAW